MEWSFSFFKKNLCNVSRVAKTNVWHPLNSFVLYRFVCCFVKRTSSHRPGNFSSILISRHCNNIADFVPFSNFLFCNSARPARPIVAVSDHVWLIGNVRWVFELRVDPTEASSNFHSVEHDFKGVTTTNSHFAKQINIVAISLDKAILLQCNLFESLAFLVEKFEGSFWQSLLSSLGLSLLDLLFLHILIIKSIETNLL